MTNLVGLQLSNNPVGDPSVLAGLSNLSTLLLDTTSITDIGFLRGLTELQSLSLVGNFVTDLTPLASLIRLNWVYLDSNPLLTDIQPLLDNPGLISSTPCGAGTTLCHEVGLRGTSVSCTDVAALEAKPLFVFSDCP